MATATRSKKEFVSSKSTGLTYHKATGLVVKSDKDYTVIGRLSEDKKSVVPMDDETVALCDEHGFEHDPIVEEEKEEANEEVEEKAEEPAEEVEEPPAEEEPEEAPKAAPKAVPKKEVKASAKESTKTSATKEMKIHLDSNTELRQYFVKEFDAARETVMSVLDNHSVFREVERAQQLDKEVTELREKVTELTAKNEKLVKQVATLKKAIADME
jgi:hypothetical protein